jgi:hypothetical protein
MKSIRQNHQNQSKHRNRSSHKIITEQTEAEQNPSKIDADTVGLTHHQRSALQLQQIHGNVLMQRRVNDSVNKSNLIQREGENQLANLSVGGVSPIQQPSAMGCWATVATMMASYQDGAAYTVTDIPNIVSRAGAAYAQIFSSDIGLSSAQKMPFLSGMGLRAEPPQNLSPFGISRFLMRCGPLWITTDGGSLNTVHARVIVGIGGDGSADGTSLSIIDPADGQVHQETYRIFGQRYENVALQDVANNSSAANPFRAQIVHW